MARTRNMFASLLIGATLLGGGALANNAAAAPLPPPPLSAVAQSTPDASPAANQSQCGDEAQNKEERDTDNIQDENNADDAEEGDSEDQGTSDAEESDSEDQGTSDTEEADSEDQGTSDAEEGDSEDQGTSDTEESDSEDQGTSDTEESDSEDQGANDTEDEDSANATDGGEQANDESDSTDASQEGSDAGSTEEDATAMATPGTLTEGQELQADASITVDEAVTAAQGEASGTLGSVELEMRDATLVYEVTIGSQEIFVNATTGEIVASQPVDTGSADCETETEGTPGALTEGQDFAPQAKVTLDEAIATATSEVSGDLGTVELNKDGDTLVYTVEVGDQEVTIDASDGHVISVDQQD